MFAIVYIYIIGVMLTLIIVVAIHNRYFNCCTYGNVNTYVPCAL